MRIPKRLLPLALCSALSLAPQTYAQSVSMELFPKVPVYRSIMADSDIIKTEINLPLGMGKNLSDKTVKELAPYVSLGEEIPLFSLNLKSKKRLRMIPAEVAKETESRAFVEGKELSDKILSTSLVLGGSLRFPENENPRYTAQAELFLGSPMVDDYLSDGNKLFLVGGFRKTGSVTTRDLADTKLSSLEGKFPADSQSFFGDMYIVAKSPYSEQFLILRAGVDNISGNTSEVQNVNLSMVFEFPSIISWIKMFKDFKVMPYVSLGVKLPFDSSATKAAGELGAKLTGESKKSMMVYGRADYDSVEGMKYSTGLKLDL